MTTTRTKKLLTAIEPGEYQLIRNNSKLTDILIAQADFARYKQEKNALYFPQHEDILQNESIKYKYNASDGMFSVIE